MADIGLNLLTSLGILETTMEYKTEEILTRLETFIIETQNSMYSNSEPLVEDVIYDELIFLLDRLSNGASPVLSRIWGALPEDDKPKTISPLLAAHPMLSIRTVKSEKEIATMFETLQQYTGTTIHQCLLSTKLNGHGVRLGYAEGCLDEATTRGTKLLIGRDITKHMLNLAPEYIELLEQYPNVEIRGELVLPLQTFETDPTLERFCNPFTAVSSLIAPSATPEMVSKLHFVAYNIFTSDHDIMFDTVSEKYEFLKTLGFEVPHHEIIYIPVNNVESVISDSMQKFETFCETYAYLLDGLVLSVDKLELLNYLPVERGSNIGNVAIKFGAWQQETYVSRIKYISWEMGKSKLTPVAVVEPVLTKHGSTLTNIPLYHSANILLLSAYEGNRLAFKYGNEAGVIPCRLDGTLLKEDCLIDMVSDV